MLLLSLLCNFPADAGKSTPQKPVHSRPWIPTCAGMDGKGRSALSARTQILSPPVGLSGKLPSAPKELVRRGARQRDPPPPKAILTPCYQREGGRNCRMHETLCATFWKKTRWAPTIMSILFIDQCSRDRQPFGILKGRSPGGRDPAGIKISRQFPQFGHFTGARPITGCARCPAMPCRRAGDSADGRRTLIPAFVAKWGGGYHKMVVRPCGPARGMQGRLAAQVARTAFYKMIAGSSISSRSRISGLWTLRTFVNRDHGRMGEPDPYFRGLVSENRFEKAFVDTIQPPAQATGVFAATALFATGSKWHASGSNHLFEGARWRLMTFRGPSTRFAGLSLLSRLGLIS